MPLMHRPKPDIQTLSDGLNHLFSYQGTLCSEFVIAVRISRAANDKRATPVHDFTFTLPVIVFSFTFL